MKKAYVNLPDSDLGASEYLVKIEYMDGNNLEKHITNYSYSRVFELIMEIHEAENDRAVKSITIKILDKL